MVGTIEGQSPYETIVFSILTILYIVYKCMKRENIMNYNWRMIMLFAAIVALLIGIAWYLYFGSFISLTELKLRGWNFPW